MHVYILAVKCGCITPNSTYSSENKDRKEWHELIKKLKYYLQNPYVLSADPCGSSSGPAISVAANLVAVSLGTETDGSILCPSSSNSVVGIKPTVGLTSLAGVIPVSPRQDTIGYVMLTFLCFLSDICLSLFISDAKVSSSNGSSISKSNNTLLTVNLISSESLCNIN